MKAKVIETGEIIDVYSLYPTIYSRLDCNGKIKEEYDEDELEILVTGPKMVSLDKICTWINEHAKDYNIYDWHYNPLINDLRKEFE